MATKESSVSEFLLIAKSREIQRAMFAEAANDPIAARPHFLAAAHMELVLANDYAAAGNERLAFRCQISAASCLWRGGETKRGRSLFNSLIKQFPEKAKAIRESMAELQGKQR